MFQIENIRSGAAAILLVLGLSTPVAMASTAFNLDFAQNPTRPSSQGLTYAVDPPFSPEVPSFQIVNNLLHLDTQQFPSDTQAFYELKNSYDHTLDAEMKSRAYVTSTTSFFGLVFAMYDSTVANLFVITHNGWMVYGRGSGTFADPAVFHDFDLKTSALTDTFVFSVDGTVVLTGTQLPGFSGPADVYFGDGSPTGGNMIADIASVSYFNGTAPVATSTPEPSTLAGAGLAIMAGLVAARQRLKVSSRNR